MPSQEAQLLHKKLKSLGWSLADCEIYAPIIERINQLKKEQHAIILSHSYQRPEIMYGVADFIGDSYGLSLIAAKTDAKKIIFCSVHFMAETAKLLNSTKQVLVPKTAGCSLAESITAKDVQRLRKAHPKASVVCYINTSAKVKAESDAICTSSNALKIVEAMPNNEIIFIPDELMAKNLIPLTKKKIISWKGQCIVHNKFTLDSIREIRQNYPHVKIIAHPECFPSIVNEVDMVGSTEAMINYVKNTEAEEFMVITECGLSDRIRAEAPSKKIVGACNLCPYMKEIMIKDVLQSLENPQSDQIVKIDKKTFKNANKALQKMYELEKNYDKIHANKSTINWKIGVRD